MLTTKYQIEKRRFSGNVIVRHYIDPRTHAKKTVKLLCSFDKRFDCFLDEIVKQLNEKFIESINKER